MMLVYAAREEMCSILAPHLEQQDALERANNIAQALLLDDRNPRESVRSMLGVIPTNDQGSVAHEICSVWHRSVR